EKARVARLTRYQHILLRLGELIAYVECAGSLSRRAALLSEGKLNEKANRRFDATALAALSRIFARDAALKVAEDGLRWVVGASGISAADITAFETSLELPAIHGAQSGLISDLDYVADVLYARPAKHTELAASRLRIGLHRSPVMENSSYRDIAIVGVRAVLPDAPNVAAFWQNVKNGRYSISEVTPNRWNPALYYDPDHSAPDKTYSKIGGWVREHVWEPMKWRLAIPPRVVDAMDESQKWAIACTREALEDYGYPERPLDNDRTAVILGNAMAGEKHYFTALRPYFPEYAHELADCASFAALPEAMRRDLTRELHDRMAKRIPDVTEDTMPAA